MMTYFRRLLTGPSPEELASRELARARRAVLEAQTAEEFARSQVRYNAAIKAALAQEQAEPETCVYREDDLTAVKSRRKD